VLYACAVYVCKNTIHIILCREMASSHHKYPITPRVSVEESILSVTSIHLWLVKEELVTDNRTYYTISNGQQPTNRRQTFELLI